MSREFNRRRRWGTFTIERGLCIKQRNHSAGRKGIGTTMKLSRALQTIRLGNKGRVGRRDFLFLHPEIWILPLGTNGR